MSVEKEPLSPEEFDRLLSAAMRWGNQDAVRCIQVLRYTGMHVSVLCDREKHNLRVVTEDGKMRLRWKRPKKYGKDAETSIQVHQAIRPWAEEFISDVHERRHRRNNRKYFWGLIRETGMRAGLGDVSPMSLRHTLAVHLLQQGVPESVVKQILNCSEKTLRRYAKYKTRDVDNTLESIGW